MVLAGYGMLVGPAASKKELEAFTAKLKRNPKNYIAQPTLSLSTVPIFTKKQLAPRHVDLRPFALVSPDGVKITPGRLNQGCLKIRFISCKFKSRWRHKRYVGVRGMREC